MNRINMNRINIIFTIILIFFIVCNCNDNRELKNIEISNPSDNIEDADVVLLNSKINITWDYENIKQYFVLELEEQNCTIDIDASGIKGIDIILNIKDYSTHETIISANDMSESFGEKIIGLGTDKKKYIIEIIKKDNDEGKTNIIDLDQKYSFLEKNDNKTTNYKIIIKKSDIDYVNFTKPNYTIDTAYEIKMNKSINGDYQPFYSSRYIQNKLMDLNKKLSKYKKYNPHVFKFVNLSSSKTYINIKINGTNNVNAILGILDDKGKLYSQGIIDSFGTDKGESIAGVHVKKNTVLYIFIIGIPSIRTDEINNYPFILKITNENIDKTREEESNDKMKIANIFEFNEINGHIQPYNDIDFFLIKAQENEDVKKNNDEMPDEYYENTEDNNDIYNESSEDYQTYIDLLSIKVSGVKGIDLSMSIIDKADDNTLVIDSNPVGKYEYIPNLLYDKYKDYYIKLSNKLNTENATKTYQIEKTINKVRDYSNYIDYENNKNIVFYEIEPNSVPNTSSKTEVEYPLEGYIHSQKDYDLIRINLFNDSKYKINIEYDKPSELKIEVLNIDLNNMNDSVNEDKELIFLTDSKKTEYQSTFSLGSNLSNLFYIKIRLNKEHKGLFPIKYKLILKQLNTY